MFAKAHEFTVVKIDDSLRTTPDFGCDHLARGQHVDDHLHVVTGERSSDDGDEHESVPSPPAEHGSLLFAIPNNERGTS
jgi:hypothetical protein